ncbi:3-hexulose-6-phosphate synthase [Anaerosolibacter sp.]|uniref:3-hexulose-6-phosphate synthase n=1 Tax=Anaerosolibacter sp. TaxID=1872527 RepID=UPI0039EE583E
MYLQLALDRLGIEECFIIVEEIQEYIDWIEIGTGTIKEYGMEIIREMKRRYPHKVIVADMKTCDAGAHETRQALEAGADITTVMAFAADKTIQDSISVASSLQKRVMVDLLGVSNKNRISELVTLGVDLVSLHIGKDMQQTGIFNTEIFSLVKEHSQINVAVAGGVTLDTLPSIIKEKPLTVIVGGALTQHSNRKEIAREMKGMMDNEIYR